MKETSVCPGSQEELVAQRKEDPGIQLFQSLPHTCLSLLLGSQGSFRSLCPCHQLGARASYLKKLLLTDHWALCGERDQGQEWMVPDLQLILLISGTGFAAELLADLTLLGGGRWEHQPGNQLRTGLG